MAQKCDKCKSTAGFVAKQPEVTWYFLPNSGSPIEQNTGLVCKNCGYEGHFHHNVSSTKSAEFPIIAEWDEHSSQSEPASFFYGNGLVMGFFCCRKMLLLPNDSSSRTNTAKLTVNYPVTEGYINSPNWIDQHGDPDLMMEFSMQYLKGYHAIMPKNRLPNRISEIAPALSLILNSAELALKAFKYRSENLCTESRGHVLENLYLQMEEEHITEIETRFAETELCKILKNIGAELPPINHLFKHYEPDYRMIMAYNTSRYFAEPTVVTDRKWPKNWRESKPMMYPIFLPSLIQVLFDVYVHTSGYNKIRRIYKSIEDIKFSSNLSFQMYGGWSMKPSMFGLISVCIPQTEVIDEQGADSEIFTKFLAKRKPVYRSKRSGTHIQLLFYECDAFSENGSKQVDGVNCDISESKEIGFTSIELYRLAKSMEKYSRV